MRTHNILAIGIIAVSLEISGCGAGGGSSIGPAAGTQTSGGGTGSGNVVSGVASEGIIKGGTVNIYAPPASGDLSGKILLKSTKTDSSGGYRADLGSYTGAVVVEVSGDNVYTDEATGSLTSIDPAAPLRAVAVVSGSGATVPVAVTPLTELATRKAISGNVLTQGAVTSANALVSNLFQFDILATRPVEPGVTALATASQAQRDYTVALAGISKLANSAGSVSAVIDGWYHDLSATNRLSSTSATGFQSAVTSFLADTTHNQTGIAAASQTLAAVGKFTGVLLLKTVGTSVAPISSLQVTLTLPAGVSVKKDSAGSPLVAVSGVADKAAAPGVNYLPPDTLVLAIISSPGFGVGEFATVTYVADPGIVPLADDFKVASSKITGFDGSDDFPIALSVVPVLP